MLTCWRRPSASGDVYVPKGGRPWISEMYGYSFGCAKAGLWHVANRTMMLYPEYLPTGEDSIASSLVLCLWKFGSNDGQRGIGKRVALIHEAL